MASGWACAVALLMGTSAVGCKPATALGTYKVDATPASNTCGTTLGVPDPWVFNVQLYEGGSNLYWSWLDGSPVLSGTLASGATATLLGSDVENLDPIADGGDGPCTMERDDTIALTLASGNPPPSFTGTLTYAYSVVSGAVCADQLVDAGGQYTTLPCTMVFDAAATKE